MGVVVCEQDQVENYYFLMVEEYELKCSQYQVVVYELMKDVSQMMQVEVYEPDLDDQRMDQELHHFDQCWVYYAVKDDLTMDNLENHLYYDYCFHLQMNEKKESLMYHLKK